MDGPPDDLASEADAIRARLKEHGLAVFPVMPVLDPRCPGMAHVYWPDESWQGLLHIAVKVDASLLYLQVNSLEPVHLENFAGDEATRTRELERAISEARGRLGAVFGVRFGFAHRGVLHEWVRTTPWYDLLMSEAEVADAGNESRMIWNVRPDVEPTAEELFIQEHTEDWAQTISEDRRFVAGANYSARREAAHEIVPELGRLSVNDYTVDGGRRARLASEVLHKAEQRLRAVVKPGIESDLQERIDEIAAALAATDDFRAARTKEERRRLASARVVEECGFRIPHLTDVLLRHADEMRG